MQQGSEEWHEMRSKHIGASDAPVCMGVSPWKKLKQLWLEKLGLGEPVIQNEAMKRGNTLEPIARDEFERITGIKVFPKVLVHPDIPYMMASLDGISEDGKTVLEIKCPGQRDHCCATQGKIPDKYMPQLQHIMCVCNVDKMFYLSYNESGSILLQVAKDQQFIDELLEKEKEFWRLVTEFEEPESEEEYIIKKDDVQWATTARIYLDLQQQIKYLEKKAESTRQTLIALTGGSNCRGSGIQVMKSYRKGSVDYGSIPQLSQVNLDKYRKPATEIWKILAKD